MKKITVVGAGIAGISAAYHLSYMDAEVVVVDSREPGQATKAAAGIICPWASQRRNKAWYSLASAGADYYPELIRMLQEDGETDTGYERTGALAIHTDPERLKKKATLVEERRKLSPGIGEIDMLDQMQTVAAFPVLSNEFEAFRISGGAKVDGRALRDALERAAQKRGVRFIEGHAVPVVQNGQILGVKAGAEQIESDEIIIAAGAWMNEFLEPAGMKLRVAGQKAQILHLQSEERTSGNWPVIIPPSTQYIVPFADGRFAAGTTHEDTDYFSVQPTIRGIEEILSKVLPIAPGLAESELKEVRVGIRPHTSNFMPVVGQLPGHDHVWAVNGLGSSGLTMGPFIGKLLSQLVMGIETGLDLTEYRIEQVLYNED